MITPEDMAWIDGNDRYPGTWEDKSEAAVEPDQTRVRYPVPTLTASGATPAGRSLRCELASPATMADLMHLAELVEGLLDDNKWLRGTLQMMASGRHLPRSEARGRVAPLRAGS